MRAPGVDFGAAGVPLRPREVELDRQERQARAEAAARAALCCEVEALGEIPRERWGDSAREAAAAFVMAKPGSSSSRASWVRCMAWRELAKRNLGAGGHGYKPGAPGYGVAILAGLGLGAAARLGAGALPAASAACEANSSRVLLRCVAPAVMMLGRELDNEIRRRGDRDAREACKVAVGEVAGGPGPLHSGRIV